MLLLVARLKLCVSIPVHTEKEDQEYDTEKNKHSLPGGSSQDPSVYWVGIRAVKRGGRKKSQCLMTVLCRQKHSSAGLR